MNQKILGIVVAVILSIGANAIEPLCPESLGYEDLLNLRDSGQFEWKGGKINWQKGIRYKVSDEDQKLIESGFKGWSANFINPYTVAFGTHFQDKEDKDAAIDCSYAFVSGPLSWAWLKAGKPYILKAVHPGREPGEEGELGPAMPMITGSEYQAALRKLQLEAPGIGQIVGSAKINEAHSAKATEQEEIANNEKNSKKARNDAREEIQDLNDAKSTALFFEKLFFKAKN